MFSHIEKFTEFKFICNEMRTYIEKNLISIDKEDSTNGVECDVILSHIEEILSHINFIEEINKDSFAEKE